MERVVWGYHGGHTSQLTSTSAPMYFTAYVNADHASNKVTRRLQTGFIIYGNCALLIWFSKKQNTIENPDKEDWEKLVRMMKFLKYFRKDVLTLQANGDGKLKWYADASFAVHPESYRSANDYGQFNQ
jgi:hypothetical protein